MATKTISIDLEAYKRLKSVQQHNESFSQVIKRVIKPPFDVEAWLEKIRKNPLSRKAVAAIEEQVRNRSRTSSRSRYCTSVKRQRRSSAASLPTCAVKEK